MLAEEPLVIHANTDGEVQVCIKRTDRKTICFRQGFEKPELDGRNVRVHEWHGNENYMQRRAFACCCFGGHIIHLFEPGSVPIWL
jgi:hypothetical protein